MQEITPLDPPGIQFTFDDRDQAIEALCLKVFGAKPQYASEPLEVEVWVHEDGTIVGPATINREHMMKGGYKLRRATIHPEEVTK